MLISKRKFLFLGCLVIKGEKCININQLAIAGSLGIKVMETDLPESVSGALIKEKGKDPIIVIHYADHNNRKRFSCAHELGHFIHRLQLDGNIDEYEYVDLGSQLSSSGTDLQTSTNRPSDVANFWTFSG